VSHGSEKGEAFELERSCKTGDESPEPKAGGSGFKEATVGSASVPRYTDGGCCPTGLDNLGDEPRHKRHRKIKLDRSSNDAKPMSVATHNEKRNQGRYDPRIKTASPATLPKKTKVK
jgi:hypothetical protein